MAPAVDEMIVDHADCLHEGIDDGRAAKLKPRAFRSFEISRDNSVSAGTSPMWRKLLRMVRPSTKSQRFRKSLLLSISRYARAEAIAPSILARLRTIPASGINALDLFRIVTSDVRRIEAVESLPKGLALAQDRDPGQPGLEAVEDELLKKRADVSLRHAPFLVVVGDIERVARRPGAAMPAVFVEEGRAVTRWPFGHDRL